KPQHFKNDADAQDAHEAIRPTSAFRTPASVKEYLTTEEYRLYTLIWSRFIASQMTSAVYDTVRADIEQNDVNFRTTGSKLKFAGFTKLYDNQKEKSNQLPELNEGYKVKHKKTDDRLHFTQPPECYTEASLVRDLEVNCVSRPSTYAPTIDTIQKRYYVKV